MPLVRIALMKGQPVTGRRIGRRELGVRPEDVFINLVEVKKENWSFGNGVAQYAQPADALA